MFGLSAWHSYYPRAFCCSIRAQVQPTQQNSREDTSTSDLRPRTSRPSDLAAENYAHLALPPPISAKCFIKDTGLLVELKRLGRSRKLPDNGQIVEDSMLTDDAIFSRLERDNSISFFGHATFAALRIFASEF